MRTNLLRVFSGGASLWLLLVVAKGTILYDGMAMLVLPNEP
jgi:hypothetical protein